MDQKTWYAIIAGLVLLIWFYSVGRERFDVDATAKMLDEEAATFASENKINPLSSPDYNYNQWKAKYLALCRTYTPKKEESDYSSGYNDLVITSTVMDNLKREQGLHYAYGQCVENGNRVCNCPDSSFTFVEDMSRVVRDAPNKPGCIQLMESPFCYSLDGENFMPDYYRLSTTSD
jgi:hypothetical protein